MSNKNDFPIFKTHFDGKVYLDSAATSQKPRQVIDALVKFYESDNSNVHRGLYGSAEEASQVYEDARAKVARYINANPSEVVFTSGATEGINFIASSIKLGEGDTILTSQVEHHSNFLPWQRLSKKSGAKLEYVPFNQETFTLSASVPDGTKIVAITMSSNVLGPVWEPSELKALIANAKEVGARVLLDASQVAPHSKIDVKVLGADFIVFSGHKMCGPTGIGVLYINKDVSLEPYQVGGSMVYSAGYDKSIWDKPPYKYEAGTPPIAQAIALGAAIDYLSSLDLEQVREHEARLCRRFLEKCDARVLGNVERIKQEGHLVSFRVDAHAHDIAAYLDGLGIMVRAGHHCAQPLHNLLGVDSSLRISFYLYNTEEDVDRLVEGLNKAIAYFR